MRQKDITDAAHEISQIVDGPHSQDMGEDQHRERVREVRDMGGIGPIVRPIALGDNAHTEHRPKNILADCVASRTSQS